MDFKEYVGVTEAEACLYQQQAEMFRALAHPVRLQILELLEADEVSVTGLHKINMNYHKPRYRTISPAYTAPTS